MTVSSNIKLVSTANGSCAVHAQENARVLSPEQILQGELFNMESVLSPPVEQKRKRYSELFRKQGGEGLAANEKDEMKQLSLEIDHLPVGTMPEDRVKEATVRAAIEEVKPKLQELK